MKMDFEEAMTWSVFALKRDQQLAKASADAIAAARAEAEDGE
jgi:hypothetical protein